MDKFEKIFYQDIREKKRAGSGIYHRASRRGYIKGGVKTASDFMTKKEKDKLSGEVKVYNMFDKYNVIENVPSLMEIEKMDINERVNLYRFLKNKYSNSVLQKHWNISSGSLYNKVYEKYNLYTPRTIKTGRKNKDGIYNNDIKNVPMLEDILQMSKAQAKGVLIAVKEEFTATALTSYWDISRSTLYKYYRDFGIIQGNNMKEKQIDLNTENVENKQTQMNIESQEVQTDVENVQAQTTQPSIEQIIQWLNEERNSRISNKTNINEDDKNFSIQLNGTYSKQSLENKILSIASILEDDSKYKITLLIEEV